MKSKPDHKLQEEIDERMQRHRDEQAVRDAANAMSDAVTALLHEWKSYRVKPTAGGLAFLETDIKRLLETQRAYLLTK